MSNQISKYELFEEVKEALGQHNFKVSEGTEINYGIQFLVRIDGKEELIRIYQSKKGTRLDLSQVKDSKILNILENILDEPSAQKPKKVKDAGAIDNGLLANELIGTDESGKGDYFGPLVIAAVYVNPQIANVLNELGVMDSKKLSDSQIREIAPSIKKTCHHTVVVIGNEKYNELYKKMGNLNKLLAWGHARAIENVLNEVECQNVLSDQFGDETLIQNALLKKGQAVTLYQRPRAEEHIAVAAASILARFEYISRLKKMSQKYGLNLPKGASSKTIEVAKQIFTKYGELELDKVAKIHFKTTEQVKG
ncbi:ribonuclease HIII [Bacillus altitudinis]|uniref:ribonuclease HIII n=1 Tax=Bacillus altitudinis TaxID=293387 RepID=UPI0011A484A2|nr:ribonuclease HIII [Bacillus altitudinis]MBU8967511.1 ribonuclease HIII [Bacillus altitudinis]MCY7673012.1 ribonuclease HIII [Bacillus altitudinis]MDR7667640.1 ribonuclease HIII [Bacillus altitudinis]